MWALSHSLPAGSLSGGACLAMGIQMLMRRTGDLAATLLDAIVLDAIPGPEYLAMANSITFSVSGIGRAVGPFIISSFFALSTRSEAALSFQRQLVWFVFILICLPCVYLAQRIVNSEAGSDSVVDEEQHELLNSVKLDESALDD